MEGGDRCFIVGACGRDRRVDPDGQADDMGVGHAAGEEAGEGEGSIAEDDGNKCGRRVAVEQISVDHKRMTCHSRPRHLPMLEPTALFDDDHLFGRHVNLPRDDLVRVDRDIDAG